MKPVVGCVPYLNAKPLVRMFLDLGEASPIDVVYDVPSRLPSLLDQGAAAAMVSSIEALRRPEARVADGVSISSNGPVLSVRLFSKRPLSQVRTLALDQSSMTSNLLARLMLLKSGSLPDCRVLPPEPRSMLAQCDAAVLIGDNGMAFDGDGLNVLDLGQAWTSWTGLPFVWAMWVGGSSLGPAVAENLMKSKLYGIERLDQVVQDSPNETVFSESQCRTYLAEIMDYDLGHEHWAGLERFMRELEANRLAEGLSMPGRVSTAEAPV